MPLKPRDIQLRSGLWSQGIPIPTPNRPWEPPINWESYATASSERVERVIGRERVNAMRRFIEWPHRSRMRGPEMVQDPRALQTAGGVQRVTLPG